MNLTNLVYILMFLVVLGLGTWLVILYNKEEETPRDYSIIKNFMPQYSNNFSEGVVIEEIRGTKRFGFRFAPKDVDIAKFEDDKDYKVDAPIVWVNETQIKRFPRGTLSPNRNEVWLLPEMVEDFPKSFRESPLGKAFIQIKDKLDTESEVIKVLRNKKDNQDKLLMLTEGEDRMSQYLETDSDLNKDMAKKISEFKDDKKGSSSLPLGSPGG